MITSMPTETLCWLLERWLDLWRKGYLARIFRVTD